MKKLFIFCLASLCVTPVYAKRDSSYLLQRAVNQIRQKSGASVAVLSILYKNHISTFHSGNYNPNQNLFQIGSITKSFTSTVILKLEAQHKLNINDSITKYLPQYPKWKSIKIRNLLNHTSGIYNYTSSGVFMRSVHHQLSHQFSPEDLVRIAYRHPRLFSPSKGWKYSNTNYVLAGMIAQKVAHEPLQALVNELIITPMHLQNTYYFPNTTPQSVQQHLVPGFSSDAHRITGMNMSWINAAGAVVSNPHDLVRWFYGIFHHTIVTPTQLNKMTQLVFIPTGRPISSCVSIIGYGLGVKCKNISGLGPLWFHTGSTTGYNAIVGWLPREQLAFAISINRDQNNSRKFYALAQPLLKLLK